jgi:putative FmdB family regulatory protein
MPTYEYVCAKCGHKFEKFQLISKKPLAICPEELCGQKRWGKGKVKRLIGTGAGLIFKGSGFYITDYRSEKYREAAKKESTVATPAASSSKTESKSAPAKQETKPAKKTASDG